MKDGSCLGFFEAPDMPFAFKDQHDFDLHIALEVPPADIPAWMEKGRALGMEVRGVSDHGMIDSIYFRDPDGYVIELAAKRPQAICVGLHPGTVDTDLSKPYQPGVPDDKLFAAEQAARNLLGVLDSLTPLQSGRVYDWAGVEIQP